MCELTDLCTFLRWENKPTVRKFEISLPSHAHDISSSPPAHGHYLLPNNSYKKTKSCRRTDGLFLLGSVHRHFSLDQSESGPSGILTLVFKWLEVMSQGHPCPPLALLTRYLWIICTFIWCFLQESPFATLFMFRMCSVEFSLLLLLCVVMSQLKDWSSRTTAWQVGWGGGGWGHTHCYSLIFFVLVCFPLGVWLSQLVWLTSLVTKSFVLKRRGKNKYDFWRHRCRSST